MTDQFRHEPDIHERDWDSELLVQRAIPDRETEVWRWDGKRLLPRSPKAVAVAQDLEAWRRLHKWRQQVQGSFESVQEASCAPPPGGTAVLAPFQHLRWWNAWAGLRGSARTLHRAVGNLRGGKRHRTS
jgi:hypothetical protein